MSYLTSPQVTLVTGGNYRFVRDTEYYSSRLKRSFLFSREFNFSPSIPRIFRILVPENSDTIASSGVHDQLYWFQTTTRLEADNEWRDVLRRRGVSKWIVRRSYWALRLGGWKAWNDNKKRRADGLQHKG